MKMHNVYSKQTKGLPMEGSLSAVLANIVMKYI